ncbi:MAG: putative DNA binding domain-containing protein [Micrococcales bacterium]|nr:putative DNA binding domain-containing protein [Micrococcales bacterium]
MSWTSDDVHEVLADLRQRGGDSTLVEVKRASGGVPNLAETLCAFANMPDGGTILLGVDGGMGFSVTGVTNVATLEAGVAGQARTAVVPPVHVEFDTVDVADKQVLVVSVAALPTADKPCRTKGRAYLRQADGDYPMSPQEVAQVVAMQDRPRHDAAVVEGTCVADLDPALVREFLAEARTSSRRLADRSDQEVLERKGVVRDGQLTLAGLYGLGEYPQQFAPSLSVTAAAGPQRPGQRATDLAHLDGPVPDLLERTVEWVARNTRRAVVFGPDGHGTDASEIPLVVVRELVANALVHRDLSPRTQSKGVEVRLLPDRLVISNPGGLWGLSRAQLGEPGGKSAVNEFLYDMGRLIRTPAGHRLIEGEGGGIRDVVATLRAADLPAPSFVDTGVAFTAIVYRPSVGPPLGDTPSGGVSQRTVAVRRALDDQGTSIAEVMDRTGLTRRQVKTALDALVAAGVVTMIGGRGNRFTTYRPTAPR